MYIYIYIYILVLYTTQYNADTTLLDVDGKFAVDYATNQVIHCLISTHMAKSGEYITLI